MPHRTALLALAVSLAAPLAFAADVPRFRGADADGVFAAETGLLQIWPEGGPKLIWQAEGLGESYASMTIAGGRIYTTGLAGGRGYVFALDQGGKQLWKQDYGAEFDGRGYPGTRNTPTVDGGRLFTVSSLGKAVSLEAETGKIRWQVELLETFGGKNTYFGLAEQPLLTGGKVIYTPGGEDNALVALDPDSGKTLWQSKGLSDNSAYCSPRLYDDGERRQIVTLLAKSMAGVDPADGTVLWRQPLEKQYDIQANSPVFHGDTIYVSHGYDQGGHAFQLAADGASVKELWREADLDVHHGGALVHDGHIYGAASNGTWYALDAATGKPAASIRRLGKGSMVFADGRLYGYTEGGEVLLVDPDPANFKIVGTFEITQGEGNHWSHPVVAGGTLYVRHGDFLMAYDVRSSEAAAGP